MKKILLSVLALVMISSLLVSVFACAKPATTLTPTPTPTSAPVATPKPTSTAATVQPIEFILNNHLPQTNSINVRAFEPWAKFVGEKTGGRVKITIYHGASLFPVKDAWQSVIGGLATYANYPASYRREQMLVSCIVELPFSVPDPVTGTKIAKSLVAKYGMNEYKDVKLAAITASDPYWLYSTKKVTKMEDMKGMKVRVPGAGFDAVIKAWGGVPVGMANEEVYGGLEKKIVDAALISSSSGLSYRLWEVAKFAVDIKCQVSGVTSLMNKNKWNLLPKDLQDLFDKELHPKLEELEVNDRVLGKEDLIKAYKDHQGEVISLAPEELAKLREGALPQWDVWVKDAAAAGYPANEIMTEFKRMLVEAGVAIK